VNVTSDTLATPVARNLTSVQPLAILDENSTAAAAIEVSSNKNTTINIGQARITTPTQAGVSVQSNEGTPVSFTNLVVQNAAQEALIAQANDAASSLTINGASRLSSASTTVPALLINDDADLDIRLVSLESARTAAPPYAIELPGGSTGTVEIIDQFLVNGAAGTPANVNNTSSATVTLPTP
jgi:hypothetical protein